MAKELFKELQQKLEEEKASLEKDLSSFAAKDPKIKGGWNTRYPSFDTGHEEEEMDEVEEYISRLPVEHSLELRLKDVDLALEKINKGQYGKCEKCKRNIDVKRLKIYPAARTCGKCK